MLLTNLGTYMSKLDDKSVPNLEYNSHGIELFDLFVLCGVLRF